MYSYVVRFLVVYGSFTVGQSSKYSVIPPSTEVFRTGGLMPPEIRSVDWRESLYFEHSFKMMRLRPALFFVHTACLAYACPISLEKDRELY